MGKKKYEVINRDHKTTFPFGWFIFFIVCALAGPPGLIFFVVVLVFVKFFTKIIRS